MTSTDTISQAVLNKIQGLLNMTEANGCSEAEAANAAAAASALMLKHRIERAELDKGEVNHIQFIIETNFKRATNWKFSMFASIAHLNGCFILFERHKVGADSAYVAYGKSENIMIVKWLYDYLVSTIERLAKEQKPDGMTRGEGKHWNNSFKVGARDRIVERLKEQHDLEKQRHVNTSAIVKVDAEADEAKKYAHSLYNYIEHRKLVSRVSTAAYEAGQAAGNQVSLNKPLQS